MKNDEKGAGVVENIWETILKGNVWTGELVNKSKKGKLYYEEVTIAPIKNQDNQVSIFIAIQRDITEKKELERKLEKL